MEHSPHVKSVLFSVITGFLALCLLIAMMVLSSLGNDLRAFLIVTALLYLLAGFLRGQSRPMSPWLNGELVSAGAR